MKTSLLAITLVGITAASTFASPARSLNQRRVEQARDASKAAAEVQARTPAAPPQQGQAPPAAGSQPARATTTPQATAPVPSGPSNLSREGKPPSQRFFSRVRTDASRNASKAERAAAPSPTSALAGEDLIYRKTWGPRSRSRPR